MGGGLAHVGKCQAVDEQARQLIQDLRLLLKGRFECEDFKFADISRESRRDNVEAHERIDGVEKHATTIHADVFESLQCEQRAATLRYSSATEELRRIHDDTKRGVEDMAGCIQDKVENRMSELHSVVHTQIEEVHERVDEIDRLLLDGAAQRDAAAARGAQLGIVVSSCLAATRTIVGRLDKLEKMPDELQALSVQGAGIIQALNARDGSRSHASDEKTSKAEQKRLTASSEAHLRTL